MRVLHVIPYMHPSAGGPPVVVEQISRHLNNVGVNSEVVTTTKYCRGDASRLVQKIESYASVQMLSTMITGFGPKDTFTLASAIKRADIVHLHTLWDPVNVAVRLLCTRMRRPYTIMPHGMLDPYSLSVNSLRKQLYLKAFERRNIECAANIIFTTEEERQLATRLPLGFPPSVVLPLGAEKPPTDRRNLAAHFEAEFPESRNRRCLLFLGRLHPKKGLDRIIRILPAIVAAFPGCLLVIAGEGDSEYKDTLIKTIESMGLRDHTLITGILEGLAKWGAFAKAEVFLLPSRQENFAIAVAEAMQVGVPVVISDKVNIWEGVMKAKGGIVLQENGIERRMGQEINNLLSDKDLLLRMGECARNYASEEFDWERCAKRYMRCYAGMIAGRGNQS